MSLPGFDLTDVVGFLRTHLESKTAGGRQRTVGWRSGEVRCFTACSHSPPRCLRQHSTHSGRPAFSDAVMAVNVRCPGGNIRGQLKPGQAL